MIISICLIEQVFQRHLKKTKKLFGEKREEVFRNYHDFNIVLKGKIIHKYFFLIVYIKLIFICNLWFNHNYLFLLYFYFIGLSKLSKVMEKTPSKIFPEKASLVIPNGPSSI